MASAETPVPQRRHRWYLDIFCYPANRSGLMTLGVMVGVPLVLIGLSTGAVTAIVLTYRKGERITRDPLDDDG